MFENEFKWSWYTPRLQKGSYPYDLQVRDYKEKYDPWDLMIVFHEGGTIHITKHYFTLTKFITTYVVKNYANTILYRKISINVLCRELYL